ncbi:MAG: hypothetical protein L0Y66_17140, partial [Myxococcaceae bacterium]|nr:hypothetical protein [Myxococcaceae bacterium]
VEPRRASADSSPPHFTPRSARVPLLGRYCGCGQRLGLRAHRPTSGERTYPVILPVSRIDWILVSPELRFLSYRTFRNGVTDHCGVVAELGLVPPLPLGEGRGEGVVATPSPLLPLPTAAAR